MRRPGAVEKNAIRDELSDEWMEDVFADADMENQKTLIDGLSFFVGRVCKAKNAR